MKRVWHFCLFAALVGPLPSHAYYHFLHYGPNRTVLPEKFNLDQLPGKTVTFYVSDAGPTAYSANDSFPSVVNQIRQATAVWNGVATSNLRVAFGGLYTAGTADNSPGGAVVFEELPPGLLAYSGPTTCEDTAPPGPCQAQAPTGNQTFLPILQSTMHMNVDLTKSPGPSFTETFYLVAVHEMGHALGLQHTFTSSAMSTLPTRNTSLVSPVHADDIAGISVLYPSADFSSQTGSITGQIVYSDDGSPVHMASVVAIRSGAPAVSALTLADGTFQIDGVPPGQYFLYVHPLPPAAEADIRAPLDEASNSVDPTRPFSAVLYPGAQNVASAGTVTVVAGQTSSGYNVGVAPRADVPVYDIAIYSYFKANPFTTNAVHPAYVQSNPGLHTVAASGAGLGGNLNVQVMGGSASIASGGVRPYGSNGVTYLALDLQFSPFGSPGPQHLLFSTSDYLYILPSAFNVTSGAPPVVASAVPQGDGSIAIAGQGFRADTQLYFDALPSQIVHMDSAKGQATVIPPTGASGQTATVTAFNSDGQNSLFLQISAPTTFAYAGQSSASPPNVGLTASPNTLPAGVEALVDITGTNTSFNANTVFGFGTHDVAVRRTFILSPTHAIVDVAIPSAAAQVTTQITAMTGFQIATAPQAFEIQVAKPGQPSAVPLLFNALPNQSGSFAGAIVTLYGTNLQASSSSVPVVTFDGQKAAVLFASPTQINLQIPLGLPPGLSTLLVNNGSFNSYPVAVTIDVPEAVITSVKSPPAAEAGSVIDVLLTGFASPGAIISTSRVRVNVGGIDLAASSVSQIGSSSVYQVEFILTAAVPSGSQVPLVVFLDGRSSVPATLAVTSD